jgi:NAD(P)-dependent dehydrogenase (short-subunit alcohol dehydrogenase family)
MSDDSAPNAGQLEGKIALVTGGAGGLGSAASRALAAAGASVIVADVDPAGEELADQIGGVFTRADVATLEANS